MPKFRVEITVNDRALKQATKGLKAALKTAVEDCIDDLVYTSSGAAPHDKGILEGSWAKEIQASGHADSVSGTVEFSVKEGDFNYALRMHEGEYNLGDGSVQKDGVSSRLSGKYYPVGNKYLTRPLEGNKAAYRVHIDGELKKWLKTG